MGGLGAQRNKPHKGTSKSSREKHRETRDAPGRGTSKAASRAALGKAERLNAAKQQRDKRRAEVLHRRRQVHAPCVVALLPLSDAVDVERLWSGLLAACAGPTACPASNAAMEVEATYADSSAPAQLAMQTVALPDQHKLKLTLLPPPRARQDPLAVVDLGRAADVVLLALSASEDAETVDQHGLMALSVLRALGLPSVVGVVQLPGPGGAQRVMKERSAAKKQCTAALGSALAGEHRLFLADTPADMQQLLRHLGDARPSVPLWRQQRPSVLVEAAAFDCAPGAADGTLVLRGYVRNLGLSVNQALHIPALGDVLLSQLDVLEPPAGGAPALPGTAAAPTAVHASYTPDAQQQESLQRLNEADPLAGEQTWPTQEELMEAEAARQQAAPARKRRLPPGTSDYQAAWILDADEDEDSSYEGSDSGMVDGGEPATSDSPGGDEEVADAGMQMDADEDDGTDFGMALDENDEAQAADAIRERRRRAAEDDVLFPDEVEVPPDVPARTRFAKYRGLKSFRTSRWDPREALPQEYSRVFAFERPRRTEARAKEAAKAVGAAGDAGGVPADTYIQLHVAGVAVKAAAQLCARAAAVAAGEALPLVAFGLLRHECKLSVLNFGLRKAQGYEATVASKEELLLVTGLRSFAARPVFSSDEHGADKHKMERFLHDGRSAVATVYAPISYGPLPLLAFTPHAPHRLVAAGSLRGCDPDRVVVKKIVLCGYPVKVHKSKAVVRFMFHGPDDIRWFRPLELWTKGGRRGRITEPVGTHGAMKCVFDGALKQQDAVCLSLYKRVFPKWPAEDSLAFCHGSG